MPRCDATFRIAAPFFARNFSFLYEWGLGSSARDVTPNAHIDFVGRRRPAALDGLVERLCVSGCA
jgi:hypothetical protein